MNHKWHYEDIVLPNGLCRSPVVIVDDALIATKGSLNGRGIPLIILDTTNRPDIVDLFHFHTNYRTGDIKSNWGKLSKRDNKVSLILRFIQPVETVLILEFEMVDQGILVESILQTQVLYIQPGKPGDRFITTMDNLERILIEVPENGFREYWDKEFRKALIKKFKKDGINNKDLNQVVDEAISKMKEILSVRMA